MTLIYGPRGSGKSELIEHVQSNVKYHLTINCDELINIPEHELLSRLARMVGYYPQFNFLVSASAFIDILISGTTGTKTNFTTTCESQIRKILDTVTLALSTFSQSASGKEYPVIFVDGYMSKERASNDYIYGILSSWAALVEENRLAHVVFVSNHPGALKVLERVMPTKPVESILLRDADVESSVKYVRERLNLSKDDANDQDLEQIVHALGGRRTDLEVFIQKLQSGRSISSAYYEILLRSVSELRKLGLGEEMGEKSLPYTPIQFWKILSLLSERESLDFDQVRNYRLFNGDDKPIQSMEHAGLITIEYSNGRPKYIRPGRPVFRAAFKAMVQDESLNAFMNVRLYKAMRKETEVKLEKIETEILALVQILSGWGTSNTSARLLTKQMRRELERRLQTLHELLQDGNKKVEDWMKREDAYKKQIKLKE